MGEIFYRGYASTGSMSSAYPPNQATNLVARAGKNCVYLTWTDPEDKTLVGGIVVKWYYTKIVRRTDRYPNDENDGVTVVLNNVRNQYQIDPYVDSGLESDVTYYYAAFACSADMDEVVNQKGTNASISIGQYSTMTVQIDFSQSDPTKMCTYADDAVGAPCGLNDEATAFWQGFFGYRPCLFKDGAVVGYLNPNDYTRFEDGTSADITSGNDGDVMIEYPRRGVKMTKVGKVLTVQVTDEQNADGYTYYAHTRGNDSIDAFYIGAYLGYVSSDKLHSISGQSITLKKSLSEFRSYGEACGEGYGIFTYYQYLYIQIMYCLQFSNNLNSQTALGLGLCMAGESGLVVGTGNTYGMVYGNHSNGQLKLFGLESPWGLYDQYIDGIFATTDGKILTSISSFNNTGDGYLDGGNIPISGYNYITNVVGTETLGFISSESGGSSSTYLCDECILYPVSNMNVSSAVVFGSANEANACVECGIFYLNMYNISPTTQYTGMNFTARLSYI